MLWEHAVRVQISAPRMKKDFCTMYLIRHGETEWNRDRIVMGHMDAPLTDTGIKQAEELAAVLRPVAFDAVYSSDSVRTLRTVEVLIKDRNLVIQKSAQLRERHFSRFEGVPVDTFVEQNKEAFAARDALPEVERWGFEVGGCVESDASLVGRVISTLQNIASTHVGKTLLVGTHGGPIRFLLIKLGFAPYGSLPPGSFKNAGYIVVESDGRELAIKEVNGIRKDENHR